ncbi:MAG: hypothetical protein H0U36_04395 [Nocardioidaceae bacterium]|nr:hypothetical protein [Nocardioidaceae bacterium]
MAERICLHIGAPKTGTTYLQQILHLNRDALESAGVLYPRVAGDAHHTALWDLRDMPERDFGRNITGDWARAVRLVDAWTGTAVMSSELFVYADEDECLRALTAFAEGTEVHVIYTARDLVRQAPAVWQERVKNQHTLGYGPFLADALGRSTTHMAKGFWRAQDLPIALGRWSQGLPPEQVHVVTTPPAGSPPTLLWERFASVLGLDGGSYDTDIPVVNTSLSVTAAELLRRFNVRHGHQMTHPQYRRVVRKGLFDALGEAGEDTSKLTLTRSEYAALSQRSKAGAAAARDRGYDIVGSLDDLVPPPERQLQKHELGGTRPDDLDDAEVAAALLDVVGKLLFTQHSLVRRAKKQSKQGRPSDDG